MATAITIRDEAERRVLEAALWHRVKAILDATDRTELGDRIVDQFDALLGFPKPHVDLIEEVDRAIEQLVILRRDITQLRDAALEQTIEIGQEPSSLSSGAREAQAAVEEYADATFNDGGFWNQDPAVRETLVASRDAAAWLAEYLTAYTEAAA